MDREENNQYYSVNNGQYYVKRTVEDSFYILNESNGWKYNPSLADEFYDILSGYVEITEEAMEEVIRANGEKQADSEAVEDHFTIDDDCVFRIKCNSADIATESIVYNDGEIHLEITTYEGSNLIESIECIYAECVEIEEYHLRDYTEIEDIRRLPDISLKENDRENFVVYLNLAGNQLDILLQEYLLATHYYVDGRIEYYYDDDLRLLYIKVKNLTAEEYDFFRKI